MAVFAGHVSTQHLFLCFVEDCLIETVHMQCDQRRHSRDSTAYDGDIGCGFVVFVVLLKALHQGQRPPLLRDETHPTIRSGDVI